MIFNSLAFIEFFCIVFSLYWGLAFRSISLRNLFLLVASYVFYGYWDWRFLFLIAFSSGVDFQVGILLGRIETEKWRKALLTVSILTNIGLLGFFKYYNFFIESAENVLSQLGFAVNAGSLNIILPVGISFYTFQTLSYTIDVYRKKSRTVVRRWTFEPDPQSWTGCFTQLR